MGDLKNFSMVRNGSVTASIPKFDITCDVVDSTTGVFIRNLSGTFPASLSAYTNAEIQEAFMEMIMKLIMLKAT